MSRLLVCGDREWLNRRYPDGSEDTFLSYWVKDASTRLLVKFCRDNEVTTVIEGCARGADRVAEDFSERYPGLIKEHLHYPAKWDEYGKRAGPLRNIQMLDEGRPDFVVAFHDNLAESKGTRHMVSIADKAGVPVFGYSMHSLKEMGI